MSEIGGIGRNSDFGYGRRRVEPPTKVPNIGDRPPKDPSDQENPSPRKKSTNEGEGTIFDGEF